MKTIKRILVASALALGACSFEVTNPGPIPDTALDDPGAWQGIVTGVAYNTARAIGFDAFYGAVAAKEYSTSGRVNATKLPLVFGQLTVDDMSVFPWIWSQGARWQAEDGIRRLRAALGNGFATNKFAGQLLMYAALDNRILGENMCEAVFDGGPKVGPGTSTAYLVRADSEATEAIAVATAANDVPTKNAALGVRASIRLFLGTFAAAAADAALVPITFKLQAAFDANTKNTIVDT